MPAGPDNNDADDCAKRIRERLFAHHPTPNPITLFSFSFSPECSAFAFLTFLISLSSISCVIFHFAGSASTLPA